MIIVDTGPLVALADADDADHGRCRDWLASTIEDVLVPAPIVAEVCYLLGSRCGPEVEAAFLDELATGEVFQAISPIPDDYRRMAHLVRQYGDLPLGGSDAAVVSIAERLGRTQVATLDAGHFRVIRPRHAQSFNLRPV